MTPDSPFTEDPVHRAGDAASHARARAHIIALGMRLGRAEARLAKGDAKKAAELIAEARAETREIVQELRELVSGIHPPALDSGLEAALTTLAARAPADQGPRRGDAPPAGRRGDDAVLRRRRAA